VKIELFYVHDCPNARDYLPELEALLRSVGVDDPVRLRLIDSQEQAVAERFLGSPTVRIDGMDVDPTAGDRTEYAVVCRLYRSPAGTGGRPPPDWVLSAAVRALERGLRHRH
jgi:hypothetical protein